MVGGEAAMETALVVSGGTAVAILLASLAWVRHFDRLVGDLESDLATRFLRDGVAAGAALVAVGVVGAALDNLALVVQLDGTDERSLFERALVAAPTRALSWLLAVGFLTLVAAAVAGTVANLRGRYLD